jgi:uncharacterized protein YPO0396
MKNEALSLDFIGDADAALAGFRLQRLEVFNWGTFDGRVWTLRADGRNALLTGDIGSGKSTLVDALTTLLVPAQRIAYNKAAGADARERTLRSYVLGHFKSERIDTSHAGRAVALRDSSSYSVILGVFHNAGYDQTVTLAQVFWWKNPQGQPARLFVAAERDLSIARDFAQFGTDIAQLRKRLRASKAEVDDSFPPYGAQLRRRFGIGEQALELFHQTVSMKSVGNLTDFVRSHMLEPFDTAPRIQALLAHFDDLQRAHEAVLKAKRQVALLAPLVADCDQHAAALAQADALRACREALESYFARLKAALLEQRIAELAEELARRAGQIARLEEQRSGQQRDERELRREIGNSGGDRIARLGAEIERAEQEKARRLAKAKRYGELRSSLGLLSMQSGEDFLAQRTLCRQMQDAAAEREAAVQNELNEAGVAFAQGRSEREALAAEIASLKARRSNIDAQQVAMRAALCSALRIDEAEIPFAGELIQLRDDARDWEGAAERVLRNFGLSLLVPDAFYAAVSDWVDRTHLKARLVYFRVRPARKDARGEPPAAHPDSLVRKLQLKSDSPFYSWLEREIAQRFDLACCTSQEQFRRETRAITRAGQIKGGGERHEKDDRHRIDDRARYVLGWSNEAKIDALQGQLKVLEARLGSIGGRIAALGKEQSTLRERLDALSKLDEYREYRELDWQPLAAEAARLLDEKRELEAASDVLKTLGARLEALLAQLAKTESVLDAHRRDAAKAEQRQADAQALLRQAQALRDGVDDASRAARAAHAVHFAQLDALRAQLEALRAVALGTQALSVEACTPREQELRKWLQEHIDAEDKKVARLRDRIVRAMAEYKEAYKLDTQDTDASVDAAAEYRSMLDQLNADDLPRFEARFKELLNENTIREVANFQSQLSKERETIKERVVRINQSLTQIDYNPGRYIVLEAQLALDADIRDFQSELRACTEGAITGSEDAQYSEAKFLQVKRIIERFRGREGTTELDRRWTAKVTDVRNWFVFAASERWREDHSEHEHYSDSGGKSGGQKEKLAYTVLAASLAYQFGLEWGASRSRSFRFVVIDEAFGRGSDESAQYGLRLFQQLNLQLLIVTPLQKIHIIEPFVSSVAFVDNEDGRASRLRNLSIEQYREERETRGPA